MRSALKFTIVAAAFVPALAFAQAKDGYLTDTAGGVVKAPGAGVCVRTSQWTPAMAIAECDPDLVKKPAPAAKKAAPAAKPAAKPETKPEAKPKKPEPLNIEEKIELQGMEFNKADMTADNKKDLDDFFGVLGKANKERSAVRYGAIIVTWKYSSGGRTRRTNHAQSGSYYRYGAASCSLGRRSGGSG